MKSSPLLARAEWARCTAPVTRGSIASWPSRFCRRILQIQPYPGPRGKWQISTEGGTEPAWNHNGKELFYRSGNKMMALDVATQPSFSAGKPHMLFEGQYFTSDWPLIGTAYDVSADGQRFLMVKATEQSSSATQINVVLNWFEELKQKVPTGKK